MSSPTSDASSSRDSLDSAREQSTKDRRRERNRLAAQKHRLRRNERMSQLEQQVLALQQEKSELVAQLDGRTPSGPALAAAAVALPPQATSGGSPLDPDLDLDVDLPHRAKRPRTSADRDYHHYPPSSVRHGHGHDDPQHYEGTIRRMEDRIHELERLNDDLNGDLTDALDNAARLKHELSHATHHADTHVRRLTDALHSVEAERSRLLRDISDLRQSLEAEAASARTLRDANAHLRESVEAAEITLNLQRVENERLRDRLADEDGEAARVNAKLENELFTVRRNLEDAQMDIRRLHNLLREQEAYDAEAAEARHRRKERDDEERRRLEEREVAANDTIVSLNLRLTQAENLSQTRLKQLELAETHAEHAESELRESEERNSSLQESLQKYRTLLSANGIPV